MSGDLKKRKESLRKGERKEIENGALAKETQWEPLRKDEGASFCTHRFVEVSPIYAEFRRSPTLKICYLLLSLLGAGIGGTILVVTIRAGSSGSDRVFLLLPVVAGFLFCLIGLVKLAQKRRLIFDRAAGVFRREGYPGIEVPLDQIKAIQIISKTSGAIGGRFRSHELNLVLKSGDRVNVVDHGSVGKIREDAEKLARFLGVQVWDAGDDEEFSKFGGWFIRGKGY